MFFWLTIQFYICDIGIWILVKHHIGLFFSARNTITIMDHFIERERKKNVKSRINLFMETNKTNEAMIFNAINNHINTMMMMMAIIFIYLFDFSIFKMGKNFSLENYRIESGSFFLCFVGRLLLLHSINRFDSFFFYLNFNNNNSSSNNSSSNNS